MNKLDMKINTSHIAMACSVKWMQPYFWDAFFMIVGIEDEWEYIIIASSNWARWKVSKDSIININ